VAGKRDPEAVRQDVIDRYVTIDHARDAYGVVIDANLEVDAAATAQLRSAAS
jgi:N-methylhydantoinase B